jgi:cysteine desulfuration protein SufE
MTSNERLDRALGRFRIASREMRLQLLLGYARRLPELPPELIPARDAGLNRVTECQSPVFLWVALEDGRVRIHADVPKEAPTVRGFVAFLVDVLDGQPPEVAAGLPATLLEDMGLAEVLGVMRTQGLGGVIRRVRTDLARNAAETGPAQPPPGA